MADWECPDGTVVRLEVEPVYCANCGALVGHSPKENMIFGFHLCNPCFAKYGAIAGTLAVPEEEFNRAVAYEVLKRYGRQMTDLELSIESHRGTLGTTLEALERDSPYPVPSSRPQLPGG